MLKFIRVRVYIGKMEALKRYLDEKYRLPRMDVSS